MGIIDYKCPNCGSGMTFDSKTGNLFCHSCGREDDIEQIPDPLEQGVFSGNEMEDYHCNSCGAVIITEAETSATICSFCGSSAVIAERLSGELAPALVIPFSISKQEAMDAFRKWCGSGLLAPRGFKTADRVKGIIGIYVPFWLYELHNLVEVHGHATKVRIYTKGDYRYTETQHYEIYRKLRSNYVKVPIDASQKMNDAMMDLLEPFRYERIKQFKTPYLAGYTAEKYSYNDNELLPRAKHKIKKYIDSAISSAVSGYTTVNFTSEKIDTTYTNAEYCLLPVWVVHYDYNKLDYAFAMNGQTGKVVGKPPKSNAKVFAWFIGIFGVSFLSLIIISWIMKGGFL